MRPWPPHAPTDIEARYRVVYEIAFRVAFRMSRSQTSSEDIAQETWLAVERWLVRYLESDTAEPVRDFRRWVHRVATNRAINLYKSRWSQVLRESPGAVPADMPAPTSQRPDELVEQRELSERLGAAVATLSRPLNEAFTLYQKGHSYEEIARALDCPVGTIKARIHRARAQLASRLQQTLITTTMMTTTRATK